MSARARRPTDEVATQVLDQVLGDDGRHRARPDVAVPAAGAALSPPVLPVPGAERSPQVLPAPTAPPAPFESFELAVTEVTPMPGRAEAELATPTRIDPGPGLGPRLGPGPRPPEPGAPDSRAPDIRSEPIRVISMKDRAGAEPQHNAEPRVPLHVQLRSIAEVAGLHDTPAGGLGRLAPPRDPRQVRARHRRANALWVGVALALACAIMLAIWLIAGR